MQTNGSHLAIWDPFCPQSPSDFEFLGLKGRLLLPAQSSGVRVQGIT